MKDRECRYDLPLDPPDGLFDWMVRTGLIDKSVITYKMEYHQDEDMTMHRDVHCVCSACETEFYAKYADKKPDANVYGWQYPGGGSIYDGEQCECPECGELVTARYIGRNRSGVVRLSASGAVTVNRVAEHIAVIWWQAQLLNCGGRVERSVYPWEAYVFDGKRCVKNVAYVTYGYFNRQEYAGKWFERAKCVDTLGNIDAEYIYPFDPRIFNGTELENAKFDIYINDNTYVFPASYLRLYQRHNTVENLVMSGSSQIVDEILQSGNMRYVASLRDSDKMINWKARKPAAMLGLTKPEYKAFKRSSLREINFYNLTKDYGITIENMNRITERNKAWEIQTLVTDFNENIARADRYIMKQQKKYNSSVTLRELIDYWRMVEPADRLNDIDVRYPQNLMRAHDELVRLKKWKEDMRLVKQFEDRYEELSVYSYRNDKFLIRPCRDEVELIYEGKTLEHCVASYAKRHASGMTSIFFIRHIDKPDEPYYTLEWTGHDIRQDHGYRNVSQTDEIKEFEKEWLEYVKGVNNGQCIGKAS